MTKIEEGLIEDGSDSPVLGTLTKESLDILDANVFNIEVVVAETNRGDNRGGEEEPEVVDISEIRMESTTLETIVNSQLEVQSLQRCDELRTQ